MNLKSLTGKQGMEKTPYKCPRPPAMTLSELFERDAGPQHLNKLGKLENSSWERSLNNAVDSVDGDSL